MERRPALDVLKGACILLVVFNHALLWPMRAGDRPSAFAYGIAFGTVAAFSAVAGYVQGFHPPRDERALLRKRAGQLLVPWAIWAPIYALTPLVWGLIGGGSLPILLNPGPWIREIALGGGPLWFLPVLFVATAICAYLDPRTTSWWPAGVCVGVYAALALAFSPGNISPLDLGNGTFWAVSPLYVASFWFGLRISRDGLPRVPAGVLVTIIVAAMLAGGVVTYVRAIHTDERWLMWLPYALGALGGWAALVLAAGATPQDSAGTRLFARMGRASLGIYVLHPVLVAPVVLAAHGRGGVWLAAMTAVGTVALGAVIVERVRTMPVLSRAL